MKERTDQELLEEVRQTGNTQAFGCVVQRHQQRVYATAYALLGDWSEAQDVAQEVFVRAYMSLGQLRDTNRFGPWLRSITAATCADWRRSGWPLPVIAPDAIGNLEGNAHVHLAGRDNATDPADGILLNEEAEVILRIIGGLPPRQRLPLILHLIDQLSPLEVAKVLHLPRATVRSLIHRGRAAVLSILERRKKEKPHMPENKPFEQELPADFVYRVLTARSIKIVEAGLQEAFRRDHAYLGAEHILVGLAEEEQGIAAQVLREQDVTPARIRQEIDRLLKPGPRIKNQQTGQAPTLRDVAHTFPTGLPAGATRAYEAALAVAKERKETRITPEHMLLGITNVECLAARILQDLGVERKALQVAIQKALAD